MVPGNFKDPQRCKGRVASLLLKHGHLVCCTIEHYLRVDIHLILLMVFLKEAKMVQEWELLKTMNCFMQHRKLTGTYLLYIDDGPDRVDVPAQG